MLHRMKSPLIWAFFLLFPLLIHSSQINGVWITRWELHSQANIEKTVKGLYRANVTDAFVQVYGSGYAFFNSSIAPGKYSDFDPLASFINECSEYGIRVHAWINLLYMWDRRDMTEDDKHILNRYPESVMSDHNGVSLLDYSIEKMKGRNIEGIYVSPASDIVNDYIYLIIEEIAENYPVDGIHLDYCRYPGREFVYDVFIRTQFRKVYTIDPDSIWSTNTERIFGNSADIDRIWGQFPKHVLNDLIMRLYNDLKDINPNIQFSAAVIADVNRASVDFYQYWWTWLNDGYLDFAVMMAYSSNIDVIKSQLSAAEEYTDLNNVVVGLGTYNQSLSNVRNNHDMLRLKPVMGFCLFSSTSIEQYKEGYSYVGDFIFK